MIDVGGTILQISVSALTVVVKGHQEGIVQQQIKTMGLREWLSLVVAWIVSRIYAETSSLRGFISPPRTSCLKLVAVKRSSRSTPAPANMSHLHQDRWVGSAAVLQPQPEGGNETPFQCRPCIGQTAEPQSGNA